MTLPVWQASHPGIVTMTTRYGDARATTSAFTTGATGSLTDPQLMTRLDNTYAQLLTAVATAQATVRDRERTALLARVRTACQWMRANGYDPNACPAMDAWAELRPTLTGRETEVLDQLMVDGYYRDVYLPAAGGALWGWVPDPCSADGHPGITVTVAEAEA